MTIGSICLYLLTFLFCLLFVGRSFQLNYWRKRNISINYDLLWAGLKRRHHHMAFILQGIYRKAYRQQKPFVAVDILLRKCLLLQDLDLIKDVMITDFEIFPDRGMYTNERDDPLSANLVRVGHESWQKLRHKLTPTFTSGKMKYMFPTLVTIGERFQKVLYEKCLNAAVEIEMRDLCARFTTDVIGNVAFGIECNSLREPNSEFRRKGNGSFVNLPHVLEILGSCYTKLFHLFRVKIFKKPFIEFYTHMVEETIKYRERDHIKRPDFMDMMLDLKNKSDKETALTMEQVISQSMVFFIAGFETSSVTLTYALYELAKNVDKQEKARSEINEVILANKGEFSYESLRQMFYTQQIIMETLRMYPVAPTITRVARSSYTFKSSPSLTIDPDVQVIFPVFGIHHNPDYYPNPEQFQPERFTSSECAKRHPMSYLPFGAGPRICIAKRFGEMQTQIGLITLLKSFRFSTSAKTPNKLKFDHKNMFMLSVADGIYLNVERI